MLTIRTEVKVVIKSEGQKQKKSQLLWDVEELPFFIITKIKDIYKFYHSHQKANFDIKIIFIFLQSTSYLIK